MEDHEIENQFRDLRLDLQTAESALKEGNLDQACEILDAVSADTDELAELCRWMHDNNYQPTHA